jgi:hypothetical protein
VSAVHGELPLAAKVAFVARFRVRGDHRDEEPAVVDTLADPPVPSVSPPQLALVEPDFDACCPQGCTDPLSCLRILRGIA